MSTEQPQFFSPSVDPAALQPLERAFEIGPGVFDPAFSATRSAFDSLSGTSAALLEAETAVKAAKDPASERRLRAAAEHRLGALKKTIDGTRATIAQRREALEVEIDAALGIPAAREQVVTALACADVRATLRAMHPGKRFEAAREAIAAGDQTAVAAILSTSPWAVGIPRDQVDLLRAMAAERFAPAKVRLKTSLDALAGVLETAGRVTLDRFGALTGMGDGKDSRAQRALKALETNGGAA